jgi:hypothetical protein
MSKKILKFPDLKIKKIHVCMWDYEIKLIDDAKKKRGYKSRSAYITEVMVASAKREINKQRLKKFLLEDSKVEPLD